MWKIIQIFDGDYGCEELVPGAKPKVSVTLEDERGEQKYISVEDEWLVENNLDIGSKWPEEMQNDKTDYERTAIPGAEVRTSNRS